MCSREKKKEKNKQKRKKKKKKKNILVFLGSFSPLSVLVSPYGISLPFFNRFSQGIRLFGGTPIFQRLG